MPGWAMQPRETLTAIGGDDLLVPFLSLLLPFVFLKAKTHIRKLATTYEWIQDVWSVKRIFSALTLGGEVAVVKKTQYITFYLAGLS